MNQEISLSRREERRQHLNQLLAVGEITQERYDEQMGRMVGHGGTMASKLGQRERAMRRKLADGRCTQKEYDLRMGEIAARYITEGIPVPLSMQVHLPT